MKIKRKIGIALLAFVSLISLSSCAFFESALNKLGFGTSESGSSNTSSTTISTSNYYPVVTSSNLDINTTTYDNNSTTTNSTNASSTSEIRNDNLYDISLNYAYNDLERYDNYSKYQELYDKFEEVLNDFYSSTRTLTPEYIEIGGVSEKYYILEDVEYTDYVSHLDEDYKSQTALAVLKSVLLDNPKFYFVSNSLLNYTRTSGLKKNYFVKVTVDEAYANGQSRKGYNEGLDNYIARCFDSFNEFMSDADKIKVVHDYINSTAKYAYEADETTPSTSTFAHNVLGISIYGAGVCESYAELFTLILKEAGIKAITVSGNGITNSNPYGESHAWNYAMINNKYYGFDLTWDDSTESYSYYGMSYRTLTEGKTSSNGKHIASNSSILDGINYLYNLPSVSSTDYFFVI